MKVSIEKQPTSEAVLDVDVTWDEIEKASDKAYRKLVKQVSVPGFRPGKAPRTILERKLGGKEAIYQEGLDDLISDAYRDAVREHELTPISQPKVDAPIFEMGQPYHFQVTVPIITAPVLGDYRSLHFEREEAEVTSEEVENELENQLSRQATFEVVERAADYGDRVTVDLKLTSEGQGISDLKDNPFELTKERVGLFTGMDEQIVGMQTGETKSFSTTIPADYSNEKLAGKQADYVVTLHKVEVKQIPELDDAFAEKSSDGAFASLEELRKSISDNILESKKRQIRDDLREKVVKAVIDQAEITLHPLLIEEQAHEMLHQLSHLLEQQHMSLDQYLVMTRQNRNEYLESIKPEAEQRLKRQLVLDSVAQQEDIQVTDAEINDLLFAYSQMGQPIAGTDEQKRSLSISMRREKAVTRLIELTTDPDPEDAPLDETEESEEAVVANAAAAALAAEENVIEAEESVAPLESEATSEETKM